MGPAEKQDALVAFLTAKEAVVFGLGLKQRFDYLCIPLDITEGRRLKRAIEQDLENLRLGQPLADFRKAEVLRRREKAREALFLYRRIVKQHSDHSLAQESGFRIGQCLFALGENEKATLHWRDFVDIDPQGPWRGHALLALGDDAFERQLNVDAAEKSFVQLIESPGSDSTWKAVSADAHERYGICRFLRRDFEGSEAALARSLELKPRSIQQVTGEMVPNPLDALLTMCRQRRHPVYHADQVMRGDTRVQTLLFLASAYLEIGRLDESLALFSRLDGDEFEKRVLPIQRDYARMERAETLRLRLELDKAITLLQPFEDKLKRSPMATMALFEKARMHLTQGERPKALQLLRRIARDWPRSEQAPRALFTAGFLAYFSEDWAGALACFRPLVARYPKSWYAERVTAYEVPDCTEKLKRTGHTKSKETP